MLYGTELIRNTTNLEICVDILSDDFVKAGYTIVNKTQDVDIFPALYAFYNMAWSVHPLIITCYEVPDTAPELVKKRFDNQSDIRVVASNTIHNISYMVDAARDIREFFISTDRGQAIEGPYMAGYGAGRILYFLMGESEFSRQKDPAEGMDMPKYIFF